MDRRSYDQFCCLAIALDHIGDRWTMLIVRELLFAPRRYTELRAALPGIATNLLSARMRSLEADGLVARRRLPPPANATIYELTDSGRALEPALIELVRWGSRWMGAAPAGTVVHPSWVSLALAALLRPPTKKIRGDYDLLVGGEVIRLRARRGTIHVTPLPGSEAALTVATARLTTTPETVLAIATGATSVSREIASGRASIDGPPEATATFSAILTFA